MMYINQSRKSFILLFLLMMFLFAACSSQARTRRSIKKKCDCRRWSEAPLPHHPQQHDCHEWTAPA
jgi:UDP-N-acetylmuramyl pentapeptide phosphotransferase/UDP-N-acetylglucosamine-1-phosphate transferase